ncbi:MAG: hypothetical protein ACYST6_12715 [Planctomycetota bacterium]|jgi:hypothetical protein
MRTFWLKAGGLVVFVVLLVITVGRIPWSGSTGPVTESTSLKQTLEEGKGDVEPQRVTPPPQVKDPLDSSGATLSQPTRRQEPNAVAGTLYQIALTALSEKNKPGASPDRNYRIIAASCREIQRRYPDSQEAEKAKELLQEVPQQYVSEYDRRVMLAYPRQPKVKKSRALRRRIPARHYQRPEIPSE